MDNLKDAQENIARGVRTIGDKIKDRLAPKPVTLPVMRVKTRVNRASPVSMMIKSFGGILGHALAFTVLAVAAAEIYKFAAEGLGPVIKKALHGVHGTNGKEEDAKAEELEQSIQSHPLPPAAPACTDRLEPAAADEGSSSSGASKEEDAAVPVA